jgi:multiple sugar transport system permease protein
MNRGTGMKSAKKYLSKILVIIVLIIGAIIMVTPFLRMILTAFKTITEVTGLNPFVPSGVLTLSRSPYTT